MNTRSSFNKEILVTAVRDAFRKLDPRTQLRNPVMFIVYIGAIITTWLIVRNFVQGMGQPAFFTLQITLWLWFTVLFANFAEAVAEGRGKAQANALRSTRSQTKSKKVVSGFHCPLAVGYNYKLCELRIVFQTAQGRCGAGRSWGVYSRRRRNHRRHGVGR